MIVSWTQHTFQEGIFTKSMIVAKAFSCDNCKKNDHILLSLGDIYQGTHFSGRACACNRAPIFKPHAFFPQGPQIIGAL